MKKIKFLILAIVLGLGFSLGTVSVNAAPIPGNITNTADLVYFLHYYGGKTKVEGNKVTLLSGNVVSDYPMTFSNLETDIVLDLQDNSIYFSAADAGIFISSTVTKNIKIIGKDDDKGKDFIRAQGDSVISSNSNGNVTIENTLLTANSSSYPTIRTSGSKSLTLKNVLVKGQKKGIEINESSTVNLINSDVDMGNSTAEKGVHLIGSDTKFVCTNCYVGITDVASGAIALFSEGVNSNIVINNGEFKGIASGIWTTRGNITINGCDVKAVSQGFRTGNATVVINDGKFKANNDIAVQIMTGSKVTINQAEMITVNGEGALSMPLSYIYTDFVKAGHSIDVEETKPLNGSHYFNSKTVNVLSLPTKNTLSYTKYTYNGYVKTPVVTVKNTEGKKLVKNTDYKLTYNGGRKYVGKYSVKITYLGKYSNVPAKTLYFTIVPGKTSITKLTRGDNSFRVTLSKRTTQTTGYQIMYSTSSKFTNAKTYSMKNTITSKLFSKKLNKKKYYVKARTYKKIGTAIYYSDWSSVKAVVTK